MRVQKNQFFFGLELTRAGSSIPTMDKIVELSGIYGISTYYNLDGYVFSMSVRSADKEMKAFVLDDEGYTWLGEEYKRKSRRYPRTIQVTSNTGKKLEKTVDEKQVVFWSEKYAKRAKAVREAALAKAHDLALHPGSYTGTTSYGATKKESS